MKVFLTGILLTMLASASLCAGAAAKPTNLLLNPSFEEGARTPEGWSAFAISGAAWEHHGSDGQLCVSVTGNRADSAWWSHTAAVDLKPNQLYHLSYWVRRDPQTQGGVAIAGLEWVNRDTTPEEQWERREFFFRTPDAVLSGAIFRLGQWHVKGKVFFDQVALVPARAVHRRPKDLKLPLGAGEEVLAGYYRALHALDGPGATDFRCLARFTARFNTNRWVFKGAAEVVYHHEIGRLRQKEAEVEVGVTSWERGVLLIEASKNGQEWVRLGEVSRVSRVAFPIPSALLPAREVWVRLRSTDEAALQVNAYQYRCSLLEAEGVERAIGDTRYLAIVRAAPDLEVDVKDLGDLCPSSDAQVEVVLRNLGVRRPVVLELLIEQAGRTASRSEERVPLATEVPRGLRLPYRLETSGDYHLTIRCAEASSGEVLWEAESEFTVLPLHDARGGDRETVEQADALQKTPA